jgi:hypothetical protein
MSDASGGLPMGLTGFSPFHVPGPGGCGAARLTGWAQGGGWLRVRWRTANELPDQVCLGGRSASTSRGSAGLRWMPEPRRAKQRCLIRGDPGLDL